MKKLTYLFAFLSLFIFCCHSQKSLRKEIHPKEVYKSIGTIKVYKNMVIDGFKKQVHLTSGTGFGISDREIITANHVCEAAKVAKGYIKLEYLTSKGRLVEGRKKLKILKQNRNNDLCLLRSNKRLLRPLSVSPNRPKIGDKVFVFGSPIGEFGIWTEGIMSMPMVKIKVKMGKKTKTFRFTKYSVPSFGGNSGSPIMNKYGEVIGMVSAGYPAYPYITFSPRLEKIRKFLGVD